MESSNSGMQGQEGSVVPDAAHQEKIVVLHIAESYGGGVLAAIRDYMRNSPDVEHHLAFSRREDAAMNERDLVGFATTTELPAGHFRRVRAVRSLALNLSVAVIHAHSSFGGAYARLALRSTKTMPIIYTPHCFGFERTDISKPARLIFWMIEFVLSFNTGTVAACSRRELRLAGFPLSNPVRVLLPNVPPHGLPTPSHHGPHAPLRLVGAGRFSAQKDPAFFVECVRALRAAGRKLDAIWVGGGTSEENATLEAEDIRITGWLPRSDAIDQIRESDVYLHTALWEGFPIAVLEASALEITTVVRSVPAFEDVRLPLAIETPADLLALWPVLTAVDARREYAQQTSLALAEYNDENQQRVLAGLYSFIPTRTRTAGRP
jgi:glycosyltransferase involved in cell wall biosynthesis